MILATAILVNIATQWQEEYISGENMVDNNHDKVGWWYECLDRVVGNMVRDKMMQQMLQWREPPPISLDIPLQVCIV